MVAVFTVLAVAASIALGLGARGIAGALWTVFMLVLVLRWPNRDGDDG